MRRGNLFILLLAVVMGGIAAFMARNWIQANATVQSGRAARDDRGGECAA